MNRKFAFIAAMVPVVSALAELNPVDTRWTFGAHEPFPMYRRVGRICTGAIEGPRYGCGNSRRHRRRWHWD